MAKLGDLILRVGADTSQLNKNLGIARRDIARNTREIQNLGRNLTVGITAPLAIMGATSVQAFREQNKAIAQVEAGLQSTAGQVGFTSKELQKMASDLQNKTLFGDEVILKDATAQLLTFTNISGQNFARTQQAALDLATRLDGDLKSASIQLGKALNDPVANLSALSRSGIQFSEDQKEVIKSLAETGQLAEAQTIILDELNKQYGGSAEAAAKADGGFTQLANSFGDLQEEIGKLLVQYLRPIVDRLKTFVQFLQGTSDTTKTFALAIAGVAAAIGPVLVILPNFIGGLKAAKLAFAALNRTMLANPFGAVAAAIGLVVGAVIMLNNVSSEGSSKVDDLKKSLAGLELEQQAASIEGAVTAQQAYVAQLKQEKAELMKLAPYKRTANSQAGRDLKKLEAALETANADLAAMMQLERGVALQLNKVGIESNKVGDLLTFLSQGINKTTAESKKLGPALVEGLRPLSVASIDNNVVKGLQKVSTKVAEIAEQAKQSLIQSQAEIESFGLRIAGSLQNIFSSMIAGTFDFKKSMIDALKAVLAQALALLAVFAVMTALTGGVGGKFFEAVGGLKGFIASGFGIPQFSEGGIVSGPTLGLVGEYPGARTNPEVIAPLDKLRGMLGGQAVQVHGRLSGRDILLSSEYSAIDRNRVRGF
jgi:hypothetical protein|tara:strand:+ start:3546 stop:5510 length:1965 start_codon:yes stop_codon:yes gene_type:complete